MTPSVAILGEDLVHQRDTVAPQLLEAVKSAAGVSHPVDDAGDERLPTPPVLADEPGSFKDGHVLLHGGEAHRVPACERRDRLLLGKHGAHDVATGGVSQRMKDVVRLGGTPGSYNHSVVGYRRGGGLTRPTWK